MLVGEEAVGVIAAVLDVLEAAAEHGSGVAARPRAAEPAHQHLVGVEVTAALGAHGAAARPLPARRLGSAAPGREGKRGEARRGEARRGEVAVAGGAGRAGGCAGGGHRRAHWPRGRHRAGAAGAAEGQAGRAGGRREGPARPALPLQRLGHGCPSALGPGCPSALGPVSRRAPRGPSLPITRVGSQDRKNREG